ncbi:MAG: hypothetical protein WCL30_07095 [Pseudomonadota bacterium]
MKKQKANPELIDEETPEWTDEMFAQSSMLSDIFPNLAEYSLNRSLSNEKSTPKNGLVDNQLQHFITH